MPAYQNTLEQMNQQSEKWVKEIQEKYNLLEQKQRKYKQEEVLLTDDLRKTRLKELEDLENEIRVQNNEIFGMNGKLFQKKKEKISWINFIMKALLYPTYFPSISHYAAMVQADSITFETEDNFQKQTNIREAIMDRGWN